MSSGKSVKNNACVIKFPLIQSMKLWDFLSTRDENVILRWVKDDRLTVRDRAKLNQKLDRLSQMPFELAIQTKLLAGPIYKNIYKLIVHGDVMLRPMLCRGPFDIDKEYTLLLGAVETGGQLPEGSKQKAADNRESLIADRSRRCPHVRIPRHS
jgi:hypothetical protein